MLMTSPIETRVIDGKAFAERLVRAIASDVERLHHEHRVRPGLAVVLVGEDPASDIYVRSKIARTRKVGMTSFEHRLPATIDQQSLLALIARLNADRAVHGILVQLPLPAQLDTYAILTAIRPDKDVDGFHVINAGRLAVGLDGLVPCTPLGCLMLLKAELGVLCGLHAVIVGCSNIVGRPMAQLLLRENCTVVITHIHTRDVAAETRRADIVVVAAGQPGLIRGDWIRRGAMVVDVGINRVVTESGTRLVGDVAFEEALGVAGRLTPVPGGVGPMTIACLLRNTLRATLAIEGIRLPPAARDDADAMDRSISDMRSIAGLKA